MTAVELLSVAVLLIVGAVGVVQGGLGLVRRTGELTPGVPVEGRPAGLLGLLTLAGGLAAGGVALWWLLGGQP